MRPDDAPDLVIGWDLAGPGESYTVTSVRCGLTFTREELEAGAQAGRELLAEKVEQAESELAQAGGICRCKDTGLVDVWDGRAWRRRVCVCRFPWGSR